MSGRAHAESARCVGDCVTALLRDQPFFGSLALRLPIRADASRETLASDGRDIRYAPGWVAETDADRIKTALARAVLACALKHHTRRGERDPERWRLASQLVTHGLLRDVGFVLLSDAEAWDGLSVEQAYDRLPEPFDNTPSPKGALQSNAGGGDASGDPSDGAPGKQDDPGTGSKDPASPASGQAPPSFDPNGAGEVMDAAVQDAAVHSHGDLPERIAIEGRGGAGFRPGFAWLSDRGLRPSCRLYLTDMECDRYPEAEPDYPVIRCNWGPPPGERNRQPWGERIDMAGP